MNSKIALIILLGVLFLAACNTQPENNSIDFVNLPDSGVKVLENFKGIPDQQGVFQTKICNLPEYEKAIYYSCGWWPSGSNRVYGDVFTSEEIPTLKEGGLFLLVKMNSEKYLAVLPLASPLADCWLDADSTNIVMKLGHHGKDTVHGDVPVFAWAYGQNPYEACNKVWDTALKSEHLTGVTKMREEKVYPEMFNYLGWCSWEQFHKNINEENMTKVIQDIEVSDIPVRYFLMDDGFFDNQSILLKPTFPNGLKALTKLRKEDKIKWMGLWHAFLGDNVGINAPGNLGELTKQMYTTAGNKLMPLPGDKKAADALFDYILSLSEKSGFDFVKVDFQTHALTYYSGSVHGRGLNGLPKNNENSVGNPVNAAITLTNSLQQTAEAKGLRMLNCNWHQTINLLYSGNSVVGRCSEDYKVGKLPKAKAHLYHSYAAIPWLGQIAWGDHDMFHSNDKFAGRMMAISKAMSGGPVYLSDDPNHFKNEYVTPLCYNDGKLLRPLAPACPLPEDLFIEMKDKNLYRAIAPLSNKAAAIVAYNFEDDSIKRQLTISATDYKAASAMIQPYPGEWKIPAEGVYLYDWYEQKGQLLNEPFTAEMIGFGDKLLIMTPVKNGWSVIGRPDKYLSATSYELMESTAEKVTIKMEENGDLIIWKKDKTPVSANFKFSSLGNGLWRGRLVKEDSNRIYTIASK